MSQQRLTTRIWGLFASFCAISAIALGGGLVMLPMMRESFVTRRGWMTDEDMLDTVAAMQSMPGIIMGNMGALIGYRVAGVPGAVAAIVGGALPPVVVIALLAEVVSRFRENPYVQGAFAGVRAAVAALILLAVVKLARQLVFSRKEPLMAYAAATIALVSAAVLLFTSVNAAWLVVAGALAGLAVSLCRRPASAPAKEEGK